MWPGSAPHGPLESPVIAPVTAMVRLLDDLGDVITRIPDDVFARRPAGRPSGSIGAHVRHCLDHVSAFLDGIPAGRVSYDHRARGTEAETVRSAAFARIRALTQAVLDLDPHVMCRGVRLQVRLDTRGTCTEVQSTVARELAFVFNHTIHHNATMALLLAEGGTELPGRFGMAPSTPVAEALPSSSASAAGGCPPELKVRRHIGATEALHDRESSVLVNDEVRQD